MNTKDQLRIFKAMENPGFYPHETGPINVRETHISKVFLTGDFVYKVKKSLNLGFLNFSTLEKRRFFCEQEVVCRHNKQRNYRGHTMGIRMDERTITSRFSGMPSFR